MDIFQNDRTKNFVNAIFSDYDSKYGEILLFKDNLKSLDSSA